MLAYSIIAALACAGASAPAAPVAPPTSTGSRTEAAAVAFAAGDGVRVAAIDGSGARDVGGGVCAPGRDGVHSLALSPDGRRVAFTCAYATGSDPPWRIGLYLVELPTGAPRRIEDNASGGREELAWSPDGRRLAFVASVDLGPAPVGAGEPRVYDVAVDRTDRLAAAHHFLGAPVWTPDGGAVVYVVGSWQHSTGPVATYRAALDGAGGVSWRADVHARYPGPDGRWLGLREPRDAEGRGEAVVVGPDGALVALTPVGAIERPLGWLGADPVVWRQVAPASASGPSRGDVWRHGSAPRRLLEDVPHPDYGASGTGPAAALVGGRLLYVDGTTAWLADLATGQKVLVATGVSAPVALAGAS